MRKASEVVAPAIEGDPKGIEVVQAGCGGCGVLEQLHNANAWPP